MVCSCPYRDWIIDRFRAVPSQRGTEPARGHHARSLAQVCICGKTNPTACIEAIGFLSGLAFRLGQGTSPMQEIAAARQLPDTLEKDPLSVYLGSCFQFLLRTQPVLFG
jgi:hypothetical protein